MKIHEKVITKSPKIADNRTTPKKSTSEDFDVIENKNMSPSLTEILPSIPCKRNKVCESSNRQKVKRRHSNDAIRNDAEFNDCTDDNYICDISFIDTVELLLEQDSESDSDHDEFEFSGNTSTLFTDSISTPTQFNMSFSGTSTSECANNNTLEVENGLLILLKEKPLHIHGCTKLTVLKGKIEVLGHILETNKTYDVYSPRGTSFLYLNPVPHESQITELKSLKIVNGKANIVKNFLKNMTESDTLAFCQLLENKLTSALEKYVPHQLYPKTNFKMRVMEDCKDINAITISSSWNNLINYVQKDSRILITGGKGVGKSTLLRYMVNQLLHKYKKVLVLDLDPGQSEFTIPGCVSSVFVTEPLLGPNYTHLQQPDRCFCVPNISILQSPLEYIESIKQLMNCYENFNECPTIINSIGYARNLASELLATVIALTVPSIIFQIDSNNLARNCNVRLDFTAVISKLSFFTPDIKLKKNYKVYKIDAPSDECTGWTCRPKQLREICIISYFSQMFGDYASFIDGKIPTYMINLSSITIISSNTTNPLAVANGSLVSLCTKNVNKSSKVYECQGWGIVRAIDLKAKLLYLITCLNQEKLQQVKYLMLGSVKIPSTIYTTIDAASGVHPYVSYGFESVFSQIPKRAYIPKK